MPKRNGPRSCGPCGCPGGGTPIVINPPGCYCQGTPASLSCTVIYGSGENAHTYGNAYQSCGLAWFTSAPGYIPQSSFPGPGYYSTTAWVDDYGFTDYYRLSCFSAQFSLGIGQFGGGLWQSPGQIYNWAMGGRNNTNTCNNQGPFSLNAGQTQPGIYFNGSFLITG